MSDYVIWRRRSGKGPGHRRIFVLMDGNNPVRPFPKRTDIQCATLEHDPFCLPEARLRENYEIEKGGA